MRALFFVLMLACAGAAEDAAEPVDGGSAADAGAISEAATSCGLSFDAAVAAFAPERVCQTTVYDRVTGYCTHWVACSSL